MLEIALFVKYGNVTNRLPYKMLNTITKRRKT